jgi:hypothetical protein
VGAGISCGEARKRNFGDAEKQEDEAHAADQIERPEPKQIEQPTGGEPRRPARNDQQKRQNARPSKR